MLASYREIGGALVGLVLLIVASIVPRARAGPTEAVPTVTDTPTATVTATPIPTATATPTPTSTIEPTATPTTDPVIEISSQYKVDRSLIYLDTIRLLNEYDLDPYLVVSVIAAESGGDPSIVSYAGACGPMQVIPKPWYPYKASDICHSSWANLIMGMRILRAAIDNADGDLRLGLAYYNCSEESVHNDGCGSKGGIHYADNVLEFWYPRVTRTLALEE
jgi:hypothetical protein